MWLRQNKLRLEDLATAFGSTFAFFYNAQPNTKKNQKSYQANAPRHRTMDRHDTTEKEQRTANSTYPKGGVSCSKDSFVVNQTLVFQIKFCGKSPALRVAANR